ncbi:MAG: hypothetical protein H7A51_13360 [Akkermansiaceae bacterium]|nr:hypothetical protein [Akkermansiaceae bacterium]
MKDNPDHIIARSITVVDSDGNPRITLNGGDNDVGTNIVLTTKKGKILQIQEQPDGYVTIGMDGLHNPHGVSISKHGLCIRDAEGKPAVTVGDYMENGVGIYKGGMAVYELGCDDEE